MRLLRRRMLATAALAAAWTSRDDFLQMRVNFEALPEPLAKARAYRVVAIAGCQRSGKSTLLNALFGTDFPVLDASTPGPMALGRTTVGASVDLRLMLPPSSPAPPPPPSAGDARANIAKGGGAAKEEDEEEEEEDGQTASDRQQLVLIDLEGMQGRERGAGAVDFDSRTALFAVIAADAVILNLWARDAVSPDDAGYVVLRSVFREARRLRLLAAPPTGAAEAGNRAPPRRKALVVVFRDADVAGGGGDAFGEGGGDGAKQEQLRALAVLVGERMRQLWAAAVDEASGTSDAAVAMELTDAFDVQFFSLPHFRYDAAGFAAGAAAVARIFSDPASPNYLFAEADETAADGNGGDGRRRVPLLEFGAHLRAVWSSIEAQQAPASAPQEAAADATAIEALTADAAVEAALAAARPAAARLAGKVKAAEATGVPLLEYGSDAAAVVATALAALDMEEEVENLAAAAAAAGRGSAGGSGMSSVLRRRKGAATAGVAAAAATATAVAAAGDAAEETALAGGRRKAVGGGATGASAWTATAKVAGAAVLFRRRGKGGRRARVVAGVAAELEPSFKQHVGQLREMFLTRFGDKFAFSLGAAPGFDQTADRVSQDVQEGFEAAACLATPPELADAWDPLAAAAARQLTSDIAESVDERRLEGTWMLHAGGGGGGADGSSDGSSGGRRWQWRRRLRSLALRAAVMGLNYAQAMQALRTARRASERREEDMPKVPLF